jgi:hypothetical protein
LEKYIFALNQIHEEQIKKESGREPLYRLGRPKKSMQRCLNDEIKHYCQILANEENIPKTLSNSFIAPSFSNKMNHKGVLAREKFKLL